MFISSQAKLQKQEEIPLWLIFIFCCFDSGNTSTFVQRGLQNQRHIKAPCSSFILYWNTYVTLISLLRWMSACRVTEETIHHWVTFTSGGGGDGDGGVTTNSCSSSPITGHFPAVSVAPIFYNKSDNIRLWLWLIVCKPNQSISEALWQQTNVKLRHKETSSFDLTLANTNSGGKDTHLCIESFTTEVTNSLEFCHLCHVHWFKFLSQTISDGWSRKTSWTNSFLSPVLS